MEQETRAFFEEYKRLEQLCGDIYGSTRGVSDYIDDMYANASAGGYGAIPGWDDDLRTLKRLRHVRNKLAHEVDAFSDDLCSPADIAWLQMFHARILQQSDPLALLHRQKSRQNRADAAVSRPARQPQIPVQPQMPIQPPPAGRSAVGRYLLAAALFCIWLVCILLLIRP